MGGHGLVRVATRRSCVGLEPGWAAWFLSAVAWGCTALLREPHWARGAMSETISDSSWTTMTQHDGWCD